MVMVRDLEQKGCVQGLYLVVFLICIVKIVKCSSVTLLFENLAFLGRVIVISAKVL